MSNPAETTCMFREAAQAPEVVRTQLAAKKNQQSNGNSGAFDSRLVSLLEELREERKYPERLIVKSSGRVFFVRTEDIDWVEASGNYVKIHTKSEAHLLRESMKNMEAKLDPKIFVRIHRSAIVNIDRINFVCDCGQDDGRLIARE